ncbi:hypothetical protein [Shewanella sp. UCD-KL21]|uniref:hypothetical protein n=1 Tax=Shewanella sp. UCD-KL21 TaxID=1917164 RepID=UPI00158BA064|nr:hypothetical protein [Shewanella sp. UCD-KL21]
MKPNYLKIVLTITQKQSILGITDAEITAYAKLHSINTSIAIHRLYDTAQLEINKETK